MFIQFIIKPRQTVTTQCLTTLKDNLGIWSAYHNAKKLVFMHHVFHIGKWGLLDLFHLSWLSRQQLQCMLFMYGRKTSISKIKKGRWVSLFIVTLTWAALDTGGPKVVLSKWVGYQLVQVGVVAQEARTGVFTHVVILEVPTGLQHRQQSSSTLGP